MRAKQQRSTRPKDRRLKQALKVIGTGIIVLAVVVAIALYVIADAMCQNEVLADERSPDGQYRVIKFQRDCGATTDFSTQVSVIPAWWYLRNVSGNLFVADTDHGKAPSGAGGGPDVRVEWMSPSMLLVSYHPDARVFKSESVVGNVSVRYKVIDNVINTSAASNTQQARRP